MRDLKVLFVLSLICFGVTPLPAAPTLSSPRASKPAPATSCWQTIVTGEQSEAERLATIDLQRYVAQVSGQVPAILKASQWKVSPRPALVIGAAPSNPLLSGFSINQENLGEQGYLLANTNIGPVQVVLAAAQTDEGAVNAIYGLLREAGYGFFLGSESAPEDLPKALPNSPVIRKPAFAIRGVLPWYNFFNSPTVWDPIDHRAFVDQLIRMGANFVGFHTYDYEPFAGYEEKGAMKWAERLRNTQAPNWGTHPMPSREFPFGTDKLFAEDYFGAASTQSGNDANDANDAIRREQDLMRDALDYAHKRGLHTCLGFEINSDPTIAENRDVFLKRLNRLLDQYPALDYIWIWQPETQGAQGFAKKYNQHQLRDAFKPTESSLEAYAVDRRNIFDRIVERKAGEAPFFQNTEAGKAARAREGARLEQFAQLAIRAIAHRQHSPKLVISGWGGDERLLSAEYYAGLDKLLPQDVVFSSLDHIWPRPRVDKVYGELPAQRQRWPIPWLELDGDQWHPQPYVHVYEQMANDALRGGSQGILGIHWRTRDIEENLAFLVDYAWQPGLTAREFFAQYARRCYASAIAPEMAQIHDQLDALGYRWVNGAGQSECAGFTWGPGTDEKAQSLQTLQNRARALLPQAGRSRSRLEWLITEMEWILRYRQAENKAVAAADLLRRNKPAEALTLLNGPELASALQTYAQRISTRGEYGVLATIETKAVSAWNDLRRQSLSALGRQNEPAPVTAWTPEAQIVLPRLVGSAPQGSAFELNPIALGGKPAWMHYRRLGQTNWKTQPLQTLQGWVRRAVIPAAAVASPGIELGFSFQQSPDEPMAYGPFALTVMPATPVNKTPFARLAATNPPSLDLKARTGAAAPIELTWNQTSQADYFKVYRDGDKIGETAVAFYPDIAPEPALRHHYAVEACRDGEVFARAETSFDVEDVPVNETAKLSITARQNDILLSWPAFTSPHACAFKVCLKSKTGAEITGQIPATRGQENRYAATLSPGNWTAQVIPVNQAGKEGSPTRLSFQWPPQTRKETVELHLDQLPGQAVLKNGVSFGPEGAVFSNGYLEMPHQSWMNLNDHASLSFEFRAERTDEMPVLLSHGLWQGDGWFVQLLEGRLSIRTPQGDAEGPAVEPGKWYSVRWEIDGGEHRLLLNGKEVQGPRLLQLQPADRPLRIGQYEQIEPHYQFHGALRNLKFEKSEVKILSVGNP